MDSSEVRIEATRRGMGFAIIIGSSIIRIVGSTSICDLF
jgi:hypothetical protein